MATVVSDVAPAPMDEEAKVANLLSSFSGSGAPGSNRPQRKRKLVVENTEQPIQELTALSDRVAELIRQAEQLQGTFATVEKSPDAQYIYQQYQATKQQLILELQELARLQQDLQQGEFVDTARLTAVRTSLQTRIDELAAVLKQLSDQVTHAREVREQFQVPDQLSSETDLANYYGVYVYNLMNEAMRDVLASLDALPEDQWPLNSTSPSDITNIFLVPAARRVGEAQFQIQNEYLASLENLVEKLGNGVGNGVEEAKQWESEITTVRARIEPNGVLSRAFLLAVKETTEDPATIRTEEVLLRRWVRYPPGAIENVYVLSGIANTRMFENDILPQQEAVGVRVQVPEELKDISVAAAIKSLEQDVQWRTSVTPAQRQNLFEKAIGWADDAGLPVAQNPKDYLLRALQGVASKLGLKFYAYAPTTIRSEALVAAAQSWDESITFQMRSACREHPQNPRETQRVIRLPTWQREILRVAKGLGPAPDGVYGWFLMDASNSPTKLFGICHGRDARRLPDVVSDFKLTTTDIGRQQGVPLITDQLSSTLDITFVCAQRTASIQTDAGTTLDYTILNKVPNNLGTLMILWMLTSLLDAGFYGTMLEVVATQESQGKEGYSQGPADTNVAAFYHRYFKYQRTASLQDFAPLPSLLAFHPRYEAYEATPTNPQNPLGLEIMYRPFPTASDLQNQISRLIFKIASYYEIA